MLKPKLNQLPHIYNIDKLRIYNAVNRLVAEINVGSHYLLWYLENDERIKPYLERKMNEMTVYSEGVLAEVIVLEIYLQ